jgi:shikimate kinase
MRGVSRTSAAVTVVNALPTGVGCALGIERYVTATVDLERSREDRVECSPVTSATPLVLSSARAALLRFAPSGERRAMVELRSEVPVSKGLKSSSAVSTAVIRAVARAAGKDPSLLEVARLSAEVGRSTGVSATGALDDGLAGLCAGFVLTDNRTDSLLAVLPSDRTWSAVVLVPPGHHPAAPSVRERFEAAASEGQRIANAARAGRFLEAMQLNTQLVERLMGYDYARLRENITAAGAVSVGVSGLGPALAALVPARRQPEVLASLRPEVGERFAVAVTTEDAP